jgi:hypothetical protein
MSRGWNGKARSYTLTRDRAKLFCQTFPKIWGFSPNFSKDSLVGLECFQWVTRRKKQFVEVEAFSKFLRPASSGADLAQNWISDFVRDEIGRKRNGIVSPAKSCALLSD